MKRLISFTISLCLVFGLVLPIHGATIEDYNSEFTSPSAIQYDQFHIKDETLGNYQETRATAVSDTTTHNLLNDLIRVFTGSGGTMYNSVSEFMSWLTPVGSFNTSHSITGVTQYEIVDYIAWTLSGSGATVYDTIANIASLSAYLPLLDNLKNALTNPYWNTSNNTSSIKYNNNHSGLVGDRFSYYTPVILDGGQATTKTNYWNSGTPIGNVALLIKLFADNVKDIYQFRWTADLTHYNDQLSTWDSQGDTLDQVLFTPESAIQGLYRYLAFTQRDVARLTYVFASDEELAVREQARENQDAVLDNFIDPDGAGSVADSDFGDIADASSAFKDNFDTGADPSNIFNIFDDDDHATPWFSNETKNQLMPQTRSEYQTPLLDNYYSDVLKYFGGDQK